MSRVDRAHVARGLARALVALVVAVAARAQGDGPRNLDDLVELALQRDPSAMAALLDAEAARMRAEGARQLAAPQVMFGGEMLGGMESMYMAGAQQMFPAVGQRRTRSARWQIAADRSLGQRDVVKAELRLRFWQSAARLAAARDAMLLIDEQAAQARALLEIGLARHASGAASESGGMSMPSGSPGSAGMAPMGGTMSSGGLAAPGAMSGMSSAGSPASPGTGGGMSGMGGARTSTAPVSVPTARPTSPVPAESMGAVAPSSLPGLLRLDASIERIAAERSGIAARADGEQAVLALFVGDAVAAQVAGDPSRFGGGDPVAAPELRLAGLDREAAQADLDIARANRRPSVMLQVLGRVTPEGTYEGTDLMTGVSLPVGSGLKQEVAAAHAEVSAADARSQGVAREIAVSEATLRAELRAARARAEALVSVAVPRANAAFLASKTLMSEGAETLQGAALSWDALLGVQRELIAARLDVELRSAELARLGAAP